MAASYTKFEIIEKVEEYFSMNTVSELYKANFINYTGKTKDTHELYIKIIADYLTEHKDELLAELSNKTITRGDGKSYKTEGHDGCCNFVFTDKKTGERREENIAYAMHSQFKDSDSIFGRVLDYQIPLKNKRSDKGVGKIDLLSHLKYEENGEVKYKTYVIELKKDESTETLLRCILESYTYAKIVDKEKLFRDFELPLENNELVIAPLVYYDDKSVNQYDDISALIKELDIKAECFKWSYDNGFQIENFTSPSDSSEISVD
ncbi:MAG: hypothetical protein MJ185_03940 [Treponema sp.]|nr:hypothetical protein [Treponema sp.]